MAMRGRRQRHDARKASRILALSDAFGGHLIEDYGLDPNRVHVVPNCIDLDLFAPRPQSPYEPARFLVLGRVVVRKGIEDVIALTQRLTDLAGSIQIVVVGGGSLWSDYRPLLADLNPEVALLAGSSSRSEVADMLSRCRCLIQASHYEPFGLTVGEALASGIPVIATTEVGAAEHLDPEVATVVPIGDVDALEAAVRAEVRRGPLDEERRERCRSEAQAHFSIQVVGAATLAQLREVAAG
jgi:glycosyltransferase involved in cell wall biosynthesis